MVQNEPFHFGRHGHFADVLYCGVRRFEMMEIAPSPGVWGGGNESCPPIFRESVCSNGWFELLISRIR